MNGSNRWQDLLFRFAPEFVVGVSIKRRQDWKQGPWRAATSQQVRVRMKAMRREGFSIGDIARACGVTWRTAWKHSNISKTETIK